MDEPSHFPDSIRHKDFYRARNEHTDQRENRIVAGFRSSMLSIPATRSRDTGRETAVDRGERRERKRNARTRARRGLSLEENGEREEDVRLGTHSIVWRQTLSRWRGFGQRGPPNR